MKVLKLAVAIIAIAVTAMGSPMDIRWDAPTLNTDGTPIEGELIYRVYYGVASDDLDVVDAITTNTTVTVNVPEGVTYWAVTAMNDTGNESALAEALTIRNNTPNPPDQIKRKRIVLDMNTGQIVVEW